MCFDTNSKNLNRDGLDFFVFLLLSEYVIAVSLLIHKNVLLMCWKIERIYGILNVVTLCTNNLLSKGTSIC